MPRAVARMTARGGTSGSSIVVRVRYAACGPSWVLCSPGRIHRASVPLTVKASVWLNGEDPRQRCESAAGQSFSAPSVIPATK